MASPNLLEKLAARTLDVDPEASEKEVTAAFREKSSDWHPDVSDEPQAREKFIAAQAARDVLLGDVEFSDPNQVKNAQDNLTKIFPESEVSELQQDTSQGVGYRSEAEQRTHPGGYTRRDFAQASGKERRRILKDVALGVETVIIYEAVESVYVMDYDQGDFFEDVNEYIEEASADTVNFKDYYEATKESIRPEVTEELFINSCEKIEYNLQDEFGHGTNIREVSRIVANFMIQGGIDIGNVGRFVGGGMGGDDERFTRGHPLGRHGSRRSTDRRFTRGGDRFGR